MNSNQLNKTKQKKVFNQHELGSDWVVSPDLHRLDCGSDTGLVPIQPQYDEEKTRGINSDGCFD